MQSRWFGRLTAAALGALLALLMLHPQTAMDAARSACRVWANSVMPALFPYMVFSQMLASRASGRLTVPLSMLGGSPAGAKLLLLSGGTKAKTQRLAALCITASPLYLLGTLAGGWRMLLAHWLGAAFAWGFVCALQGGIKSNTADDKVPAAIAPIGIPEAIRDTALAMLSVCGCMTLFGVVGGLLERVLTLPPPLSIALSCVMEMAGGCARIQALGLSDAATMPILCAVVSFGGLSIFMQNATFLRPAGVDLKIQFSARLFHAAAAYGLCRLLLYLS